MAASSSSSSASLPTCSFDWQKLTPWDPCWEEFKHTMIPTVCGRQICKHHWLSHMMMECTPCKGGERGMAIGQQVARAVAFTKMKDEAKKDLGKHCSNCGVAAEGKPFPNCKCRLAAYCDKQCQGEHRKQHKKEGCTVKGGKMKAKAAMG